MSMMDVVIPKDLDQTFRARLPGRKPPEEAFKEALEVALRRPEVLFAPGKFYAYTKKSEDKISPDFEFSHIMVWGPLGSRLRELSGIYNADQDDIYANALANYLGVDLRKYDNKYMHYTAFHPEIEHQGMFDATLQQYTEKLNAPESHAQQLIAAKEEAAIEVNRRNGSDVSLYIGGLNKGVPEKDVLLPWPAMGSAMTM